MLEAALPTTFADPVGVVTMVALSRQVHFKLAHPPEDTEVRRIAQGQWPSGPYLWGSFPPLTPRTCFLGWFLSVSACEMLCFQNNPHHRVGGGVGWGRAWRAISWMDLGNGMLYLQAS